MITSRAFERAIRRKIVLADAQSDGFGRRELLRTGCAGPIDTAAERKPKFTEPRLVPASNGRRMDAMTRARLISAHSRQAHRSRLLRVVRYQLELVGHSAEL